MSEVSYFQRYSQAENHVTNNTLLVLRHVYNHSPSKLQKLLDLLGSEDLRVGVSFNQQKKSKNSTSIPDAIIEQSTFKIIIETKTHDRLKEWQLKNHNKDIKNTNDFLIGLTTEQHKLSETELNNAKKCFNNFYNITYVELTDALKNIAEPHETALREIIEDYIDFIRSAGLINDRQTKMFSVPVTFSLEHNIPYDIYYEPTNRPSKIQRCKFIGLYNQKKIKYVGEIIASICIINNDCEHLREHNYQTEKEKEYLAKIKQLIPKLGISCFTKDPHRFYIIDKFCETNFEKKSKYPLQGLKYFDLEDYIDNKQLSSEINAEQLSQLLKDKKFE
jgi:hypothetical protein